MRYIDKNKPCLVFEDFLKKFGQRLNGDWEKLKKITEKNEEGKRIPVGRNALSELFQHLRSEQKCLCVYCQQIIPEKTKQNAEAYKYAHIEHIQKQELHRDLVFNQKNLTISCNGFDTEIIKLGDNEKIKEFCGHFKDGNYNLTEFDSQLFLNPTLLESIEDYFEYEFSDDDTEIYIVPSQKCSEEERRKAKFTIQVLGLRHQTLCEMRRRQYELIAERIRNGEDVNELLAEDYDELPAFYSMLKEKFL